MAHPHKSDALPVRNDFRSGLEHSIALDLYRREVTYEYETRKIFFERPVRVCSYKPDFILPNGIVVEGKGRFQTNDRQKHKWISAQHPALDIRFVFSNSRTKINKGSKTSYAKWCTDYGFEFTDKLVPVEWLDEPFCQDRWDAIYAAGYQP